MSEYGLCNRKLVHSFFLELLYQGRVTAMELNRLEYVHDDDSMKKPFDAPPVIVNFFYHEKIKKSAKKGGKINAGITFCGALIPMK